MDADRILESDVFDRDGRHLGRVDAVWREPGTGRAEFACLHRGLTADLVVPVSTARWDRARRALILPYSEETIRRAPHVPTSGDISDPDEDRLRGYYGLPTAMRDGEGRGAHARAGDVPSSTMPGTPSAMPGDPPASRGGRFSERYRAFRGPQTDDSEHGSEHIRLRQVLRLEREPQVRGEVERETVVEDDVIIPVDEDHDRAR